MVRQRDRDRRRRVRRVDRLLDEADHLAVLDAEEAQIAGLLQRGIAAADVIEPGDIGLDVAGLVPVPDLDLVLLGIEIFLATRYRLVFEQFEAAVDAVGGGQRRGQRGARFERPGFAALQMIGQDIGRVDEEIRPVEIALGVTGQLGQILLDLPLRSCAT